MNYDAYKVGYKEVIAIVATDMDDNALFGEFGTRIVTFNLGSCACRCVSSWLQHS